MIRLCSKQEEAEEEAVAKVQTSFALKIKKFDETKKVPLIKFVKTVMEDMNLVQVRITSSLRDNFS